MWLGTPCTKAMTIKPCWTTTKWLKYLSSFRIEKKREVAWTIWDAFTWRNTSFRKLRTSWIKQLAFSNQLLMTKSVRSLMTKQTKSRNQLWIVTVSSKLADYIIWLLIVNDSLSMWLTTISRIIPYHNSSSQYHKITSPKTRLRRLIFSSRKPFFQP